MITIDYNDSVFINCPFDSEYSNIFEAIIFTVYSCGFKPRCAFEDEDASEVRLDKLYKLIGSCKYNIHDISHTTLDEVNNLPRFNMPLELGIALGAKRFGKKHQNQNKCLIFDSEKYRFQKFISDIAGQDIKYHNYDSNTVIRKIRDWLLASSKRTNLPGQILIIRQFEEFKTNLPDFCTELHLDHTKLNYIDLTKIMTEFIKKANQP